MNNDELQEKLKELKIEDFIWVIYIGIIIMSFIANNLERKYFVFNDLKSKEQYRKLMILIFTILVIVYLYFLNSAFEDVQKINDSYSEKKKNLIYLSFIASLFVAISGFIFLYILIEDENIDVEIAFN